MDKGKQRYVAPGASALGAETGARSHTQLVAALGTATSGGASGAAAPPRVAAGINAASHAQPPTVGVVVRAAAVHALVSSARKLLPAGVLLAEPHYPLADHGSPPPAHVPTHVLLATRGTAARGLEIGAPSPAQPPAPGAATHDAAAGASASGTRASQGVERPPGGNRFGHVPEFGQSADRVEENGAVADGGRAAAEGPCGHGDGATPPGGAPADGDVGFVHQPHRFRSPTKTTTTIPRWPRPSQPTRPR